MVPVLPALRQQPIDLPHPLGSTNNTQMSRDSAPFCMTLPRLTPYLRILSCPTTLGSKVINYWVIRTRHGINRAHFFHYTRPLLICPLFGSVIPCGSGTRSGERIHGLASRVTPRTSTPVSVSALFTEHPLKGNPPISGLTFRGRITRDTQPIQQAFGRFSLSPPL